MSRGGSGACAPEALVSDVEFDPPPELRGESLRRAAEICQPLGWGVRLEWRLHPSRVVAKVVLSSSKRVALLQEAVALWDELVLKVPQHLLGAHRASQEGHSAHHGILGGHRVHELAFCTEGGG